MSTSNTTPLSLIDPLADPRWDPFVEGHPDGSIYVHSRWITVIADTYRQAKPKAVVLEDGDGSIRAALPFCLVTSPLTGTRIVSLPFTSYCDPMVQEEGDMRLLLDGVLDAFRESRASYYELRPLKSRDTIRDTRLKVHDYHKTHILSLEEGFEKVSRGFHRDCIRRSVKKAVKSGVTVRQGSSQEDFATFYRMHARTRKRLGLPIQPFTLFRRMWEIMYPHYLTFFLAEFDSLPIGGLVLFRYGDMVTMEHITSLEEYLPLRPNHLLIHSAIEEACRQSCKTFDFGKTVPENTGLLDFKRRWGPRMLDASYFYYPDVQGLMSFEQSHTKQKLLLFMGRHMPMPVAKMVGRMVYHHLG